MERLSAVDVARGIAVVAMIELHVFDAFADVETRRALYGQIALFVGGGAAPMFLTLAGLAAALGWSRAHVPRDGRNKLIRRGVEVFSLGLLFRVQEWALGGEGASSASLVRVDVLNCLGLSIVIVGLLLSWLRRWQAMLVIGLVWIGLTPWLSSSTPLEPPLGYYLGGPKNLALFPLFPWAGFALVGAALGAYAGKDAKRLADGAVFAGCVYVVILVARLAFPEALHFAQRNANPVFALEKTTGALALVALARYIPSSILMLQERLKRLGTHSLLTYWIHVDLCYGLLFHRWQQKLSAPKVFLATVALVGLCYGVCLVRERMLSSRKEARCPSNVPLPS